MSLVEHLANGRPWHLDRNRGGMLVERAVLGSGVEVAAGAQVGGDGGLVLLGSGTRADGRVEPGTRVPAL